MPQFATTFQNFFQQLFGDRKSEKKPAPAPKKKTKKPAVTTRQAEIERIARERIAARKRLEEQSPIPRIPIISDLGDSFRASVDEALGAPASRTASGIISLIRGTRWQDELDIQRAINQHEKAKSTAGNILGSVYGPTATASGLASAGRLAATKGSGTLASAGRALEGATTLRAGEKAKNVLKILAGGAVAGGAQQAGETGKASDIGTGALVGASASVAVTGLGKALGWLGSQAKDVVRASGARKFLREYLNVDPDKLTTAVARHRADTGAEPTLYEVLPLEGRNAVKDLVNRLPASAREQAAELTGQRARNLGPEMARSVQRATQQETTNASEALASDLAASRGTDIPLPEERALAESAVRDPLDLGTLSREEARNIMAPFDDRVAYESVDNLTANRPDVASEWGVGDGTPVDKEVAGAIRNAAGSLRLSEGITIRNVTQIMRRLRDRTGTGSNEADVAQRAINHLEDILARDHPDAAEAIQRMTAQRAGKHRIEEGAAEGAKTRLRENLPKDMEPSARQKALNSYETPEGATGRLVGQRGALLGDFGGSPGSAARRAADIADTPNTQEALARNLGSEAGQDITRAAQAQSESLRRLGDLAPEKGGDPTKMDPEDVITSLAGLHPSSFLFTKFRTLASFWRIMGGVKESQATQIAEMLFSQNPAQTARAIGMLKTRGERGAEFLREFAGAIVAGNAASKALPPATDGADSADATAPETSAPAATQDYSTMSDEELMQEYRRQQSGQPDYSTMSDEELMQEYQRQQAEPYGESVVLSVFPDAQITDAVRDLNSRLGRANPDSYHVKTDGAVDLRPIPGVTFEQFIAELEAAGYTITEAIDETKRPSGHATGPHWHVAFG